MLYVYCNRQGVKPNVESCSSSCFTISLSLTVFTGNCIRPFDFPVPLPVAFFLFFSVGDFEGATTLFCGGGGGVGGWGGGLRRMGASGSGTSTIQCLSSCSSGMEDERKSEVGGWWGVMMIMAGDGDGERSRVKKPPRGLVTVWARGVLVMFREVGWGSLLGDLHENVDLLGLED